MLPVLGVLGEGPAAAAGQAEVVIGLLRHQPPTPGAYDMDAIPEDQGVAGGRLAIQDNNTTGRFTGQSYRLEEAALDEGDDPIAAARHLVDQGAGYVVLDLAADEVLAVADALKNANVVLLNAGARDDRLRGRDCRANLFHVAPSRAMLTDALAQFLALKRWRKLFLIVGPQPGDRLYADAMKRSANKFGLIISAQKDWEFGPLAKAKADSPTTAEALVFTRGVDYDVAIVADEAGDFGDYVAYRNWDPRIIAGTQGLEPATWHPAFDVWGAAQAQSRFMRLARRTMRPADYQVWLAVRSVGDAVTVSKNTDPQALREFMRSSDFSVPGYKGVPLTFRPWDQQLRQPILVVQPRALVSVAPEPGFLHQRTPLDTLGFDQPESDCHLR
jgi:ABC transporter substrate binding protein (PQQ-dependent alcohol dehydrogenase system)